MLPLETHMSGRDNNYNLLRFLAACFIAFYHCFFMAMGPEMTDDRFPALYQLSQIVLNFFFIASGFLIAQSFQRRKDIISYSVARFLRLIPGVFVLSLIICFIIGPIVTEIPLKDYFTSLATWTYVPVTTALQPDAILPGVFASNPNPNEIDTALWTLRYEVVCYIGLAILGLWGALKRSTKFTLVTALIFISYGLISYATSLRDISAINHMMHFGLSFFIGTFFYVYRDKIPLSFILGIGLGLVAFGLQLMWGKLAEPIVILASAYIVFWLAYIPTGFIRRYNLFGDYSYGVYIYHYPTQQVLMYSIGGFSPLSLFFVSLPLTIVIAILSWERVEKPSLAKLGPLSEWLKSRIKPTKKNMYGS